MASDNTLGELTPRAHIHPNPTSGDVNLQLFAAAEAQRRIVVYDAFGRVAMEINAALNEGWNLIRFEVSGFHTVCTPLPKVPMDQAGL